LNPITVFSKYPINHFKQSRWFYPVYDGTWLVGMCLLIGTLLAVGYQAPVASFAEFDPAYFLALPFVTYFLILCNVFAHNVAHRNFPKAINRLVGEIVGFFVLTRYASWEIIHLRHHRYSDQPGKDPHDCVPGFWLHFLPYFVLNVEKQLKQNFYDHHGGDTPENRRFEKMRALLSFATGAALIATFYVVAGAPLFCLILVPAEIITIVHLAHFNWSTHNGFSAARDYGPINIDRGFYYIGNRIFFGIYYHDNHHRMVKAFNPMRVGAWLDNRRSLTKDQYGDGQPEPSPLALEN
jgi:fatty acid desaturase